MKELDIRQLPPLLQNAKGEAVTSPEAWASRRREIMTLLEDELFGRLPACEYTWQCTQEFEEQHYYLGGKGLIRVVRMDVTVNGKPFSWRFHYSLPKCDKPVPLFLQIGFSPRLPFATIPVEEINGGGFGLAFFDYQQVSTDDDDFTSGLSALFYPDGRRGPHDGGKIALWSWASSRIMDYLCTVPEIDHHRVTVIGHSRLGKTALWAGARDERFCGVAAIQSGCGGAAIARQNTGETVASITEHFPFWFAPAYAAYADREEAMPFDQHFLAAMAAPRKLYISSAAGDLWADPLGEWLCCHAVSPVYELLGRGGVQPSAAPGDDITLHQGQVAYHRRPGTHFFSRADWQRVMAYFAHAEDVMNHG